MLQTNFDSQVNLILLSISKWQMAVTIPKVLMLNQILLLYQLTIRSISAQAQATAVMNTNQQ